MTNKELIALFKQMNSELDEIYNNYSPNDYSSEDMCFEVFSDWKKKVILKLSASYKNKLNRLDWSNEAYLLSKNILRDMYFKYNMKKSKSKENMEILRLLQAREENIDFEVDLVELISPLYGDSLPISIEKVFYDLGYTYNAQYHKTNREDDISNLYHLSIKEIHNFIANGLFRKKYYIDACRYNAIDYKVLIREVSKDFEEFIKNSLSASETIDLLTVLDVNINMELLFHNKANTKDEKLNELIEEAKDRFLSNDKQVGLEKLWDAYERLKTYFANGKKKKESANKISDIISEDFDKEFIENEFKSLTKIGNNYRIRHHETDKEELNSKHINYFFFRMLSLIDLCLMYLNEEDKV